MTPAAVARAGGDIDVDIAVVGAGPVGATLALALNGRGLRVALLEAQPPALPAPGFDERSVALAYGTRRMLDALGLWPELDPRPTPIHTVHVSERGRPGTVRLTRREQRVDALGYVITARAFGVALERLLAVAGDVRRLRPATVRAIAAGADAEPVRITLDDDRRLYARLLVGADGARSPVRELLGVGARRRDFAQRAIVANLRSERGHGNVAFERFTEAGALALLPLSDDRSGLVYTTHRMYADALLALPDEAFLQRVQQLFGDRLGRLYTLGRRESYPIVQVAAKPPRRPRLALVGNAAQTLHPIAGQGLNLGLRDVAALAELIVDARRRDRDGFDPGDPGLLQRFGDWRECDRRSTLALTEGLVRLFAARPLPVRAARAFGLAGFGLLPGARRRLARRMMGLDGRLPRLVRGVPL